MSSKNEPQQNLTALHEQHIVAQAGETGRTLLKQLRRQQNQALLPSRYSALPSNAAQVAAETYRQKVAKTARALGWSADEV